MRRFTAGFVLLLGVAMIATPASAVRPFRAFQSVGQGRAVDLQWSDGTYRTWLYAATGAGVFSSGPNPVVAGTTDQFGCIRLENAFYVELGCGLLDVEVDPELTTATVTGWMESDLYERVAGNVPIWLGVSRIDVDITAEATGPLAALRQPLVLPFLHSYVREATDGNSAQLNGSILSVMIGGPSGVAGGTIYDGAYSWTTVGA